MIDNLWGDVYDLLCVSVCGGGGGGGRMVGVCDAGMHDCMHICLYFHVHLVDVICV